MMASKEMWQIVMGGSGGQGLVLAGVMLGEAAAYHLGKEVAQTQSYGIASRGGYSESRVVIANEEIVYPDVDSPDVVIALTAEAYARHKDEVLPGGVVLVDTEAEVDVTANPPARGTAMTCPMVATARQMGAPQSVNALSLGVLAGLTDAVSPEALRAVIVERFSNPRVAQQNLEAFEAGVKMGKALRESRS